MGTPVKQRVLCNLPKLINIDFTANKWRLHKAIMVGGTNMSKCLCCGFENSDDCTFCTICGHPVEENGFYIHNLSNNSEVSVEDLNKKIISQNKEDEDQTTKYFKKLDKATIENESAKINNETVKENKNSTNKTSSTEKSKNKKDKKSNNNVKKSTVAENPSVTDSNEKISRKSKKSNKADKTEEIFDNQLEQQINTKPMVTEASNSKFFQMLVRFLFGTKDITSDFDNNDIERHCIIAIVSYIPFLFFVPMLIKPRSGYLRFHGIQGLTMFLVGIFLEFLNILLNAIISSVLVGIVGSVLTIIITVIINMCILLLISTGIANSVKGIARELPIIGKYKLLKQ